MAEVGPGNQTIGEQAGREDGGGHMGDEETTGPCHGGGGGVVRWNLAGILTRGPASLSGLWDSGPELSFTCILRSSACPWLPASLILPEGR